MADNQGRNLVHYACMSKMLTDDFLLDLLQHLKLKGFDFNVQDSKGRLPLHYMVKDNYHLEKSLELLLEKTISHSADLSGQTPLMILAKKCNSRAILEQFVEKTEDLNIIDSSKRCFISNLMNCEFNIGRSTPSSLRDLLQTENILGS